MMIDMFDVRSRITEYTPYIIVSLQESDRMNVLLKVIRGSLLELELGIAGALNITDPMESLSKSLQTNAVDAAWAKKAYSSLKGLSAWFADLILRVEQLVNWTNALALLKSLWLSGLFNPMSFLTAVMQVNARLNNLPLDLWSTGLSSRISTNSRSWADSHRRACTGMVSSWKARAGRTVRVTRKGTSRNRS